MKIGVLTSSRADFGIQIPLLQELSKDTLFDTEIIAFGTHTSPKHGMTINEIVSYNFGIVHKLKTPVSNNNPKDIAKNIAKTTDIFSTFWEQNQYDYIIALGDRYEMFSAVLAASPFNYKIVHIHGGETTLGAIDNMYRHSISLMSQIIFCSTPQYVQRAKEINPEAKTYNVGALSTDNLKKTKLYSKNEFLEKFEINLNTPTILMTFHPETVNLNKNIEYTHTIINTLEVLAQNYQIVITLPNADTMGDTIRNIIIERTKLIENIKIVESFGMKGYLSCMKYSKFMLGNTSSGFVEAAFFPKWVINIGDRQKGRILTSNIIQTSITQKDILKSVSYIESHNIQKHKNIYGNGKAAQKMIHILKQN